MDVQSKNSYALLGNTSDQDSDREPEPPTKAIEKPTARSGKRDAPKAAPAPTEAVAGQTRGGERRRGGFSGSEAAFRDRATGRNYNRDQPSGEGEPTVRPGRDSGPGVRRAGRGPRGPRRGGDRHSRTGISEHPKQEGQGWGQATGEGEYADEKAGEAIATAEIKEGGFDANPEAPVDGAAAPALPEVEEEPEDTNRSYADYLAEKAAKKLEGLGLKEARQANEGSKENKKWNSAKELSKDEEDAYFVGQERARRERERGNKKEFVEIDFSFKEAQRGGSDRGGRGGRGRGGRGGRGGERGGDFAGRSRGRGGRGRGGPESANAGSGAVAVNDESAFPSLGGK